VDVSDADTVPEFAPHLLVLQHISCEPPGAYEDEVAARGGSIVRVEVDAGEPLPDPRRFDGIIVMGGPMGAYEEDRFPWLSQEKQVLADAVRAAVPIWGVCLGAQLLAAALGAHVAPGPAPEVGVLDVELTEAAADDAVFSLAPLVFRALQWHGDTFALPAGARHLARSPAYAGQAFAVGGAYGVQFHIEVGEALGREWGRVPAYAASLETIMGPGALTRLLADVAAHETEMRELARRLFAAWLDRVVGPRPGRPAGVNFQAREAPPAPAPPLNR
jgi:GMP synthase-like glutamine amidotransferase